MCGNISYTLHVVTSFLEIFNCPFANVGLKWITFNMAFRLFEIGGGR